FSFGSVLYEMLTGRQAFAGESVSEILAAVLIHESDFSLLPARLNPRVSEVLRRCLAKNPKLRWQATGDLRVELEAISAAPTETTVPVPVQSAKPFWKHAIPVVATAIVFSAVAGYVGWNLRPSPSFPVIRYPLVLPDGQQFLTAIAS